MTNAPIGMRVMKEAMVKKMGGMTFFPITLRPKDQLAFDVGEAPPYPSFQRYLATKYAGRGLKFVDLLNDDYPVGHSWVESDYKKAIKAMAAEDPPRAEIIRVKPTTKKGRAARTLEHEDAVVFSGTLQLM
jgi:hypothetical protein